MKRTRPRRSHLVRSSVDALASRPRPGPARRERIVGGARRRRRPMPRRTDASRATSAPIPSRASNGGTSPACCTAAARTWGFQITFFRAATGIAGADASALRAGAAGVRARRGHRPRRTAACCTTSGIARSGFGIAAAATARHRRSCCATGASSAAPAAATEAAIGRAPRARPPAFASSSSSATTQPVLLQGDDGRLAQGPGRGAVQPLLQPAAARGAAARSRSTAASRSPSPAAPGSTTNGAMRCSRAEAVGWDWIGMNLDDGGALTAFRLRRARRHAALDAAAAIGPPAARCATSRPTEVVFAAGRRWTSPASKAAYPVEWTVDHAGRRLQRRGAAGRPGARQPRPAPARSTGKACRGCVDARRPQRRPRLPRDDRLRRRAPARS